MQLKDIFEGLGISLNKRQEEIEIASIKIDEESIGKGDLFFDLKGNKNLNKVFEKGASFVVRQGKKHKSEGKNVFMVSDSRKTYALACKNFYHSACDELKIVGVTGTNGKSTTVKLVADILSHSGKKVGTIGTMGCRFDGNTVETGFTTPDPHILHRLFYNMKIVKVEYVVMEVSAHAIALKKLEGIKFEILSLTNITQDHLDFFGDMQTYANTKLNFFQSCHAKQGLVCIDDDYGQKLCGCAEIPIISYGVKNPSDIFAIDEVSDFSGSHFICNVLDEVFIAETKLVGDFNVVNSLCAIGICFLLGLQVESIKKGLKTSQPEEGRFNIIEFRGINIVIDYAHTPDGLEKILTSAKSLCQGKLVVLFGCGGNRDQKKRPIMGSIAQLYADKVFLTSDNPRFENPREIIEDIEKGMIGKDYEVEVDRRLAISKALSWCQKGDCLVIAGKGGERYQDVGGVKTPYNDFDEVHNFFRKGISLVSDDRRVKNGS